MDQLFIHDPDGYMVEICNCEKLPMERSTATRLSSDQTQIQKKELRAQLQSTIVENIFAARARLEKQGISLNC